MFLPLRSAFGKLHGDAQQLSLKSPLIVEVNDLLFCSAIYLTTPLLTDICVRFYRTDATITLYVSFSHVKHVCRINIEKRNCRAIAYTCLEFPQALPNRPSGGVLVSYTLKSTMSGRGLFSQPRQRERAIKLWILSILISEMVSQCIFNLHFSYKRCCASPLFPLLHTIWYCSLPTLYGVGVLFLTNIQELIMC